MIVTNLVDWFQGAGPFPMTIACETLSGCYISNYVNESWTSVRVEPSQSSCRFLKYKETYIANASYTQFPG